MNLVGHFAALPDQPTIDIYINVIFNYIGVHFKVALRY